MDQELQRAVQDQEWQSAVQVFYKDRAAVPVSEIDPFDPNLKPRIDRPSDKIWDLSSRPKTNPLTEKIAYYGSRDSRKSSSKFFLDHAAKSQSDCDVLKGCSWSGGNKVWSEKWLGITYVALHSLDSLCVVARKMDLLHLEKELPVKRPTYMFLDEFWNVIVSDVEDIEERFIGVNCSQPFYVVTAGATHESPISRVELTTKFLQGKLQIDPPLSSEETVQAALLATQYLYGREVEAGELQVFVWHKDQLFGKELLQFRENPDLEEYLASVNVSDNDDPDIEQYLAYVNRFDVDDLDFQEYLANLTGSKRYWKRSLGLCYPDAQALRRKFYNAANT